MLRRSGILTNSKKVQPHTASFVCQVCRIIESKLNCTICGNNICDSCIVENSTHCLSCKSTYNIRDSNDKISIVRIPTKTGVAKLMYVKKRSWSCCF